MLHLDEARQKAVDALQNLVTSTPDGTRLVLIADLFGLLRAVLWAPEDRQGALLSELKAVLKDAAERYWTGEVWLASGASEVDSEVYEQTWQQAKEVVPGRLKVLDRHRSRGTWFSSLGDPAWPTPETPAPETPAILVFYSFKGGVGRSTALTSFAIRQARRGQRVVVIDADLDAPGVSRLLAADTQGTMARWGVIDYLLERSLGEVRLQDYYHACRRASVTGPGEILVFPASRVDGEYLGKLARVDLEPRQSRFPFDTLLEEVRSLEPHWILFDSRAGLADPAGWLLGGSAHLHVIFATSSEQSWAGVRLVIERLGAERIREGQTQADCLLVQSMVPPAQQVSQVARLAFTERAKDEFTDFYYVAEPEGEPDEGVWYVGDAESSDAPHVPVPIHYNERLAYFSDVEEIADLLDGDADFRLLEERILGRFGGSPR
jgi:hypothetical protein